MALCARFLNISVEDFCPKNSYQNTWSSLDNGCTIPKKTSSYPSCAEKVQWMREHWKSDPCYETDFGVNGTLCSFLIYLSEVESWCPRLPGVKHISPQNSVEKNISKVDLRGTSLEHLIGKLTNVISESRLNWIRSRVVRMYSYWEKGRRELKKRVNIVDKPRMKILIHIGVLAEETRLHFAQTADKGGPLGELVQWGDIIASLYTLGHDIYVTVEHSEMLSLLVGSDGEMKRSCPPKDGRRKFDLFFTDYYGLSRLHKKANQLLDQLRCTLRIVDSFGTEAQFNYNGESPELGSPAARGLNLYGKNNLNLKQYMTMFPHSPDNTFLGFIVDSKDNVPESVSKTKISLTYGKHYSMWKDLKNREFLDIIHEKFEIHATTGGLPLGQVKNYLPEYVVNHGVVGSAILLKLLKESTIFIGLGFPYEGPAPLEAIAQGCFFINPKFKTARNRENTPFFKGKPTFRALTSQHPYAEEFIGEPRVLTVDIEDREAVTEALEKIINSQPSPYLPFEFTHEGMLERVNALIHNQDFCNKEPATIWPPLTSRIVITALIGQSCKDACFKKGLVCEPAYFESINKEEFFLRASFPCSMEQRKRRNSLVAPAYVGSENICVLQAEPLLYSCTTRSEYVKRICPCREYRKGQVALCKTCY
ncbi:alpha-1,6-mannosylglycoprotein 6-beta-N-acetylglucosaminyltransferase A-like isoform X2 [Xenia sp. Carnegie-2017]|uniref:alpha-1,6-mannosylglycoprotein 6-beta-N-acetylglucosaminyltransferase A-like isoform X2 n=1 Tax=Xenia sp. Carnegie-2017 TaxID=2897299 RepID=UPI001F03E377|nr:alpha-1,6-mannosylglycoprotein 6-beta-N-acetylglucosaminyltransferase A-like isoform X2 [Xenia sp. Carnegie-2017]